MRILRSNVLGKYIPAFFEMYVDTNDDNMQIDIMSSKARTVLFHEYIHFLQDFATYYGLNNLYVHSEYIHSVVNRIYKCKDKKFPIPFKIQDNDDNVLLNQLVNTYTYAYEEDSDEYYINDIIVEDWPLDAPEVKNPQIKSISCVTLNPNVDDMISFGAYAIRESMAYIMERCCSPNDYEKSPNYPYLMAEQVAKYYDEDFSSDLLKVLALCDMSLQCSNPGVRYVRIMENIRDRKLKFESPEAIYDYIYRLKYKKSYIGECSFIEGYKHIADQTKTCLKSYYKGLPITPSFYAWIDRLFDFAIDWRENNRYFLLDMARCKDLSKNNAWGYAIAQAGTPLMSNKLGHYYLIPPRGMGRNEAVTYFKAIYEIEKVFSIGSHECSMLEWCKDPCSDSTPNDLCKIAPWKKVSERKLCPFAYTWKHWKLSGYEPQHNAK